MVMDSKYVYSKLVITKGAANKCTRWNHINPLQDWRVLGPYNLRTRNEYLFTIKHSNLENFRALKLSGLEDNLTLKCKH